MNHYVSLSLTNRKTSVHLHALFSPRTALGQLHPTGISSWSVDGRNCVKWIWSYRQLLWTPWWTPCATRGGNNYRLQQQTWWHICLGPRLTSSFGKKTTTAFVAVRKMKIAPVLRLFDEAEDNYLASWLWQGYLVAFAVWLPSVTHLEQGVSATPLPCGKCLTEHTASS
jgi:hypothetical protein